MMSHNLTDFSCVVKLRTILTIAWHECIENKAWHSEFLTRGEKKRGRPRHLQEPQDYESDPEMRTPERKKLKRKCYLQRKRWELVNSEGGEE